jgi:hypothetical protein
MTVIVAVPASLATHAGQSGLWFEASLALLTLSWGSESTTVTSAPARPPAVLALRHRANTRPSWDTGHREKLDRLRASTRNLVDPGSAVRIARMSDPLGSQPSSQRPTRTVTRPPAPTVTPLTADLA